MQGLQSSEGLSGAGGFASKAADSRGWQVSATGGGRPQLPFRTSLKLLQWPHSMRLASPRASDPRERVPHGSCDALYDLVSKVPCHFHLILYYRPVIRSSQLTLKEEGILLHVWKGDLPKHL